MARDWFLFYFTFNHSILYCFFFCRRNGAFRSKKKIYIYICTAYHENEGEKSECATFLFVFSAVESIVVRELAIQTFPLGRSPPFRCTFQCPDCSLLIAKWALGYICRIHCLFLGKDRSCVLNSRQKIRSLTS